ncbi:MAG: 7-cyano-7-deazaguanine synthase QueC [Alphaproteobacteria bacterium]|nr:7-cyano-7-deazaguanine synthase QueC [Alphaproteobacteria bacterium]
MNTETPVDAASTETALVLFSGGQDSTTCLAWALDRYDRVETIGFDYGQRHHIEMACRDTVLTQLRSHFPPWAERLGNDHIVDLTYLRALGATAMTHDVAIEMGDAGLPNTFVPGRNLAFLNAAGALAYRRGISVLVGGMCETDYSGYPDCRRATIDAQETALSLGMDRPIRIDTPLMQIDKAATWALADNLGGSALTDLIIEHTHTCYRGDREHRHNWGYGCDDCPACDLRSSGYARFLEAA